MQDVAGEQAPKCFLAGEETGALPPGCCLSGAGKGGVIDFRLLFRNKAQK